MTTLPQSSVSITQRYINTNTGPYTIPIGSTTESYPTYKITLNGNINLESKQFKIPYNSNISNLYLTLEGNGYKITLDNQSLFEYEEFNDGLQGIITTPVNHTINNVVFKPNSSNLLLGTGYNIYANLTNCCVCGEWNGRFLESITGDNNIQINLYNFIHIGKFTNNNSGILDHSDSYNLSTGNASTGYHINPDDNDNNDDYILSTGNNNTNASILTAFNWYSKTGLVNPDGSSPNPTTIRAPNWFASKNCYEKYSTWSDSDANNKLIKGVIPKPNYTTTDGYIPAVNSNVQGWWNADGAPDTFYGFYKFSQSDEKPYGLLVFKGSITTPQSITISPYSSVNYTSAESCPATAGSNPNPISDIVIYKRNISNTSGKIIQKPCVTALVIGDSAVYVRNEDIVDLEIKDLNDYFNRLELCAKLLVDGKYYNVKILKSKICNNKLIVYLKKNKCLPCGHHNLKLEVETTGTQYDATCVLYFKGCNIKEKSQYISEVLSRLVCKPMEDYTLTYDECGTYMHFCFRTDNLNKELCIYNKLRKVINNGYLLKKLRKNCVKVSCIKVIRFGEN